MNEALTLKELSKRLAIPVDALRILIRNGRIECSRPTENNPIVGIDAAVEFCLSVGLRPERVIR